MEKKISFLKLSELPKEQKDDIIDNHMTAAQFKEWKKYYELLKQAANQRIALIEEALNQKTKEVEKLDEALNQKTKEVEKVEEALNQVRLAQNVMIEISRDAKLTIETPETRRINIERAKVLSNVLANPLATD